MRGPIRLIGCGKMGGAMAEGWLEAGLPPGDLQILEPDAAIRTAWTAKGAQCTDDLAALTEWPAPRALVLAVKPQKM
ncbi:MAG: NAD(P)-binding domain-containing protein, partial [Pseudomonadota bacterium]